MPKDKTGFVQRRTDLLTDGIVRRQRAVLKQFGVDEEPKPMRKLSRGEKVRYLQSMPPERQAQLWQEMDEEERQEITKAYGGQ